MNGLAFFGWGILALITGWSTFVTLAGWFYSNSFSGKTEGGVYIFAVITGILWTILYKTCPFTITIN